MLKNFCKATGFDYDSHGCNTNGECIFARRLAGHTGGLFGVAGRPFSAHLLSVSKTSVATVK
jgi:hypothetical protein